MPVNDIFHNAKYSIGRGKYHAAKFQSATDAFLLTDPYRIVFGVEPETGDHVQKIRLVKPMPEDLKGLALDAVSNLRNALDQMMFAITGKMTYFPIGETLSDFENAVKGRCKEVPIEILEVIRGFKPYRGGNFNIWELNKLANSNKHGIIVPCVPEIGEIYFPRVASEDITPDLGQVGAWDFTKNEMELNRFRPDGTYKSNISIAVYIGFHGIPEVEGTPAVEVLNVCALCVETVFQNVQIAAADLGITSWDIILHDKPPFGEPAPPSKEGSF
jgi:hypothetical protein